MQLQQGVDQKTELVRAQSHIRTLEEQYVIGTCEKLVKCRVEKQHVQIRSLQEASDAGKKYIVGRSNELTNV